MKFRKEFIEKDELLDESYYKEAGWLTSKLNQLWNMVSSPNPGGIDLQKQLVSKVWLENACQAVIDWAFKQEKDVFSLKEIKTLLKESEKNKDDIKIILTHLERTDRMKVDSGCVKIGEKGEVEDITEVEKATFKLHNSAEALDEKIEELREKMYLLRDKAKVALKNGNKNKAMSHCKERKLLEKMESTFSGMKMKIDKQIMDIHVMMSTKDTMEVLKMAHNEQQIIDEDLEDAEELMDAISDQNYNLQKINELFTEGEGIDENDEELLKELQEEDEAAKQNVPDYEEATPEKVDNKEHDYEEPEYHEEEPLYA